MEIFESTFKLSTNKRCEMIDITDKVQALVSESNISNGTAIVSCPHTTAAITINENADPSVMHDILLTLEELLPQNRPGYRHSEGNSDAHVKSSMFGYCEQLIIKDSRVVLGTWQGIFFCEFDGPRTRKVSLHIQGR